MSTWVVEEQVASITEDFDGEAVLHPRFRESFDTAGAMLVELHEQAHAFIGLEETT